MAKTTEPSSPDQHGVSLTKDSLDALRYDGQSDHPDEVAGILRSYMPSGVRVLDVGCGTGSVTLIANRGCGNEVVAIEPDEDRASLAAARGLDVRCRILDDEFVASNDKFDVVMFADVIEHLPAPAMLLDTALAALKPGGLILASVPNVAHWTVRLGLLFGRFNYQQVGIMDATHLRWFTAKTIRELFEQRGLEVLEMRQSAGVELPIYVVRFKFLPPAMRAGIVRALNRLFPLVFGCQHVLKAKK